MSLGALKSERRVGLKGSGCGDEDMGLRENLGFGGLEHAVL